MYEPLQHIRKDVWDDDYSPEHPYAELPGKHNVGSSERYRREFSSVRNTSTSWYYDVTVGPKVDIWNRHIKGRWINLHSLPVVKFLKYRSLGHITDLHLTMRQRLKQTHPNWDLGPEPDWDRIADEYLRARSAQGSPRKVEGDKIPAKVSCDKVTEAAGRGSVEAPADVRIMPEKATYMTRECTVVDTPAPCAARDGREGGVGEVECPAPVQEQPIKRPMERRFLTADKKQPIKRPMERRFLTADKKQPIKRRSSIADKKRPAVSSCKSPLQTNRLLFAVRSLQRAFVSRCELQRAFASLAIYCQLTRAP